MSQSLTMNPVAAAAQEALDGDDRAAHAPLRPPQRDNRVRLDRVKALALKSAKVAALPVVMTVEMLRALYRFVLNFIRWLAAKFGARVSGPSPDSLTPQDVTENAQGVAPHADVVHEAQAFAEADPEGRRDLSVTLHGDSANDSHFVVGDTQIPAHVAAGAVQEGVDKLVEHLEMPNRPDISMLADPDTAVEWLRLSLEQMESLVTGYEAEIHRRREEMEQLVTRLSISEGASPEVIRDMLEDPSVRATLDADGSYERLAAALKEVAVQKNSTECAMRALLQMPHATQLPAQSLRLLRERVPSLADLLPEARQPEVEAPDAGAHAVVDVQNDSKPGETGVQNRASISHNAQATQGESAQADTEAALQVRPPLESPLGKVLRKDVATREPEGAAELAREGTSPAQHDDRSSMRAR